MKRLLTALIALVMILCLCACNTVDPSENGNTTTTVPSSSTTHPTEPPSPADCVHSWTEGNCLVRKTCTICGFIGNYDDHNYQGDPKTCTICGHTPQAPEENEIATITVRFHYHRPDGDYEKWDLWVWDDEGITPLYPPYALEVQGDEAICEFNVKAGTSVIGYIVRYNEWEKKDVGYDQHINITGLPHGTVDFYVEAGVPTQSSASDRPTREELEDSGCLFFTPPVL